MLMTPSKTAARHRTREMPPGPIREFYASENGDTWSIASENEGVPVVVHQANQPSGGQRTEWKVDTFLTTNLRHTPQHKALLQLIAGFASPV